MGWRTLSLMALFLGSAPPLEASQILPQVGSMPSKPLDGREGKASFSGQVIAPACVLEMEDAWQVVDIGIFSFRQLQNVKTAPEKHFLLRLQDCDLASTGKKLFIGSWVRVTFDGMQGETSDKFATMGQAKGIDLQIIDEEGVAAIAGKSMPPLVLKGNEQGLNYALRLVPNGESIKAGEYFATLRFKVDYE